MPERRKSKSGRRTVFRIVLIALLSVFIGISLYTVNARRVLRNEMPMPFGFGMSVVLSGSMEPTLSVNDLVVIRSAESYQTDDVVVYQSGGSLTIHRVVRTGNGFVVTRGDANNTEDDPVALDAIKGRMILVIPLVGVAVRFLQTLPGTLIVIALAVFLVNLSWTKEKEEDDREIERIKAEIRRLKEEEEKKQQ